MSAAILIRDATENDAARLLEIYRPIVENTAVSFETSAPSVDEFAQRIISAQQSWAWLVAEDNGIPVGYAYGSAHRPREAYRFSVETSAYVHADYRRRGIAGMLYHRLMADLANRGYANAYAGVALPNDASLDFHRRMGFEYIGVFPRVGNKFGRWYDVAWLHRPLAK